ncbi:MAG: hypothetical protein PHU25_11285 [Deltaproteobacteria bacterium]|nr:hypothetical protein [Deltaproteobacteria bacterium]
MKKNRRHRRELRHLSLACLVALGLSCSGSSSKDADGAPDSSWDAGADTGDDSGTNTDTGSDSDSDADGDADTDSDTDGDADLDAGGDAGEDAGPDSGNDAGIDSGPSQSGCIEGTFLPFHGNLHAHTGASDGTGSATEAFAYARDSGHLDVMAVTDHLEQLYTVVGTPSGKLEACQNAADAVTVDGTYVALCGFEYTSGYGIAGSTGHNNVFFANGLFPWLQPDFHDFYNTVRNPSACPDCVVQFNHPLDEASMHWNHFQYDAAVDAKMNLFEFNGTGPTFDTLFQALDKGWHVSPTNNEDNHAVDWGTKGGGRTGLWLADLSRDSVHAAMKERRTFMTRDNDATIRLMAQTTCWMGSILSGYPSVSFDVEAWDSEAGDGFSTIELFGPGKTLLQTMDCAGADTCSGSYDLGVSGATYVVARANQADGDFLVSAPVWVEP